MTNLTIPAAEVARAFDNAALFVGDKTRPVINCARFTVEPDALVIEATDSYALFRERLVPSDQIGVGAVFYVDEDTLKSVAKLAKAEKGGNVRINVTEGGNNPVEFVVGNTTMGGGSLDMGYPNVDGLRTDDREAVDVIGLGAFMLARLAKVRVSGKTRKDGRGAQALRFQFNGQTKPVVVKIGDDIDVLQMPVRF